MTVVVKYHRLIRAKFLMGDTKLLNFFVQKIISGPALPWHIQRLVFSGMEKRYDFKESVSAHCFTKCITSKIRSNTPVISFCKSNVAAWQKNQSYEILQFFSFSKVTLNCGFFLSLLAYWLVSWQLLNERTDYFLKRSQHREFNKFWVL